MQRRYRLIGAACLALVGMTIVGCPVTPPAGPPAEFTAADANRGGAMYDKWWNVTGVDAPTEDHPLWATQDANTRSGADTWRCKECHGWDYKGVDGAYASGSHMTGFAGLFGTTKSAQEVFDTIATGHGLLAAGLASADVWDLAKFVLEGQIDTDDIIDADGAFTGTSADGQVSYDATCLACHGADGLMIPPGADADHDDWVGLIANENAWEFQHKVRFGQPGSAMPPQQGILTTAQVGDLGAFSQTLPQTDDPQGFIDASAARGGSLYDKWWVIAGVDAPTEDHAFWALQDTNVRTGADTWRCKECHGWDYKGVDGAYSSGSHMTGFTGLFGTTRTAQEVFDMVGTTHGFLAAGLVDADVWDLAKFVLEGQVNTDDIIDADGMFTGSAADGQVTYDASCMACHGADGLMIPPGADAGFTDFVGAVANANAWEMQHKIRFGQPGVAGMPPQGEILTTAQVGDLGAHSQTLPIE